MFQHDCYQQLYCVLMFINVQSEVNVLSWMYTMWCGQPPTTGWCHRYYRYPLNYSEWYSLVTPPTHLSPTPACVRDEPVRDVFRFRLKASWRRRPHAFCRRQISKLVITSGMECGDKRWAINHWTLLLSAPLCVCVYMCSGQRREPNLSLCVCVRV